MDICRTYREDLNRSIHEYRLVNNRVPQPDLLGSLYSIKNLERDSRPFSSIDKGKEVVDSRQVNLTYVDF